MAGKRLWIGRRTDVEEENPTSVGRVAWAHDLREVDREGVKRSCWCKRAPARISCAIEAREVCGCEDDKMLRGEERQRGW
jgi:hypothetical protein